MAARFVGGLLTGGQLGALVLQCLGDELCTMGGPLGPLMLPVTMLQPFTCKLLPADRGGALALAQNTPSSTELKLAPAATPAAFPTGRLGALVAPLHEWVCNNASST